MSGVDKGAKDVNFINILRTIQDDDLRTFEAKNSDYGNSFRRFHLLGLLVRVRDKIDRAISVISKNELKVNSESVRDTLNDLRIYCLMNEGLWRENIIHTGDIYTGDITKKSGGIS